MYTDIGKKKILYQIWSTTHISYTYTNIGKNGPSLVSDILCVEVDR
jgi:hypothetical protein